MRRVGEDHVTLNRRQFLLQLLHQRHKRRVKEHQTVFGVTGDVGDLIGKQARIDGVIDRADAGDAVPGLEMPPGIPCKRRNAVAELHAFFLQPLRDLQRALADFTVIGAVNRAFDRARDHLAIAMLDCGMVDDAMAQQRPILHQSEHSVPPPGFRFILNALGRIFCLLAAQGQAQRLVLAIQAA